MTHSPSKQILSASRRTDIPAFYMDWFMDRIGQKFFTLKNPYTKATRRLDVSCDLIHSIVFWSKNYETFIRMRAGETLKKLGYNVAFQFTINSESPLLEPSLPPLKNRLEQLQTLASLFGPENISWRFDPICFFQTRKNGPVKHNLVDFSLIADTASKLGIRKCVTSFFDNYQKIQRRLKRLYHHKGRSIFFTDPSLDRKTDVIHRMEKHLASSGMVLHLCCEKQVFQNLNPPTTVLENACIDGNLLKMYFGGNPECKRDYGQRSKQGCNCTGSIDIGIYDEHPCFHNCLFCYANPAVDTSKQTSPYTVGTP